jgi:hypothetical protein
VCSDATGATARRSMPAPLLWRNIPEPVFVALGAVAGIELY